MCVFKLHYTCSNYIICRLTVHAMLEYCIPFIRCVCFMVHLDLLCGLRFLFLLLGPFGKGPQYHEIGRSISTLMTDEVRPHRVSRLPPGTGCAVCSQCKTPERNKCNHKGPLGCTLTGYKRQMLVLLYNGRKTT